MLQQDEAGAWLGASVDEPLLRLGTFPDAVSRPPRTTGLYHFAILLPRRADLAVALRHLTGTGYPLQGTSDHLVSEALYLADPDGNGIEIYADRPRDQWPYRNGSLEMATIPLNVGNLMQEADSIDEPWQALPAASRMGHVHLHVGDLAEAERFYCDLLGFERMMRYGQSASSFPQAATTTMLASILGPVWARRRRPRMQSGSLPSRCNCPIKQRCWICKPGCAAPACHLRR